MAMQAAENLIEFFDGKIPQGALNAEQVGRHKGIGSNA